MKKKCTRPRRILRFKFSRTGFFPKYTSRGKYYPRDRYWATMSAFSREPFRYIPRHRNLAFFKVKRAVSEVLVRAFLTPSFSNLRFVEVL